MNRCVVYPGTFDPVTNGHIDLIERSLRISRRVIVGIAASEAKAPLFSLQERVAFMQEATLHLEGVEVEPFDGLLVDYVQQKGAEVVLRGLRATSDFEYELQMALANRQLSEQVETIFMMPCQEHIFISSRIVKAVAALGGDVRAWVPPVVHRALQERYPIQTKILSAKTKEG